MENQETTQKKKTNFFTDENGDLSMRRLIAFLSFLMLGFLNTFCVLQMVEDKNIFIVINAAYVVLIVLMMFFTSWADVASVAKAVKKGE